MICRLRRWLAVLLAATLAGAVGLLAWGIGGGRAADVPWSPLDLADPIGVFTGRKLAALGGDAPRCRALLARAGLRDVPLAPLREGARCGYDDAVRLVPGGASGLQWRPANVGVSCPVAAALALWEWDVVQPAARMRLGSRVVAVEHFGSYNCRRLYGRSEGAWSEHARANALDVAGFRLADGRRISVARDWRGDGAEADFLRAVRDGACRLFATVLSPDYNAAHADHLHLDQARRGAFGGKACR